MDTYTIRKSLVWGRIRTMGVPQPSKIFVPFEEALAKATIDDLRWAHGYISRSRAKRLTRRTKRIAMIEARLRELQAEAGA